MYLTILFFTQLYTHLQHLSKNLTQIVKSREQVMDDSVGSWRIILSYGYTSQMLGR